MKRERSTSADKKKGTRKEIQVFGIKKLDEDV